MKRIVCSCLVLSLGLVTAALGQRSLQLPNLVGPSPSAASFSKHADAPVSLYTGVPSVEVPMYALKVRDAVVSAGLSYHAGGIRVDEESSIVGLGWSLAAGGSITRTVYGRDDLTPTTTQYNFQYFNDNAVTLPDVAPDASFSGWTFASAAVASLPASMVPLAPFLLNPNGSSGATPDDILLNARTSKYEYEPDLFTFSVGGFSGRFMLDRNRKPVLERQEKLLIQPIGTDGNTRFTIRTPDGTLYEFSDIETYSDVNDQPGMWYNTASNSITGWFLSKVTSPLGEVITYTYRNETRITRPVTSRSSLSRQFGQPMQVRVLGVDTYSGYPCTLNSARDQTDPARKQYSVKYLSQIDFATGRISFDYATDRVDVLGDLRLQSVKLSRKDGITYTDVKQFDLNNNAYFDSQLVGDAEDVALTPDRLHKRMKLVSVQEKALPSGATMPPYSFNYNESRQNKDVLPAKTSFAKDFWGFSNGSRVNTTTKINNITPLPSYAGLIFPNTPGQRFVLIDNSDRQTDPDFVTAFSLKSVQYPTGGTTAYDYEANDYTPEAGNAEDISWAIKRASTDGSWGWSGPAQTAFNQTIPVDLTNVKHPTDPNIPVYTTLRMEVTVVIIPNSGNPPTVCTNTNLLNAITGSQSSIGQNTPLFFNLNGKSFYQSQGSFCLSDDAKIDPFNPQLMYAKPAEIKIVREFTIQGGSIINVPIQLAAAIRDNFPQYIIQRVVAQFKWVEYATNNFYAGGLRVKRITTTSGSPNDLPLVKRYEYKRNDNKSSGLLLQKPQFAYYEELWNASSQTFEGTRPVSGIAPTVYTASDGTEINATVYYNYDQPYTYQATIRAQCRYFTIASENLRPTATPVGYSTVTEFLGENGENGKVIYTFNNTIPTHINYSQGGFVLKPTPIPYVSEPLNGLLRLKTQHDATGRVVAESESNYVVDGTTQGSVYAVQKRPYIVDGGISLGHQVTPTSVQLLTYPALKSSWIRLQSSTDRIKGTVSNDMLVSNTEYQYSNPLHLQPTTVITEKSNGTRNVQWSLYPEDYASGTPFIDQMKNRFIVRPIETVSGVINMQNPTTADLTALAANLNITAGAINVYRADCSVCLDRSLLFQTSRPVAFSAFRFSNRAAAGQYPFNLGANLTTSRSLFNFQPPTNDESGYVERVKYDTYDAQNNLTQYTVDGEASTQISWQGVYPSSTTKNALLRGGTPALQTTYEYDVLWGVIKQTEPNGLFQTFTYDEFGRLKLVKRSDGSIVKSYDYKFSR